MPTSLWRTLWQDSKIRTIFGLAIILRLLILGYLALCPGGIVSGSDSMEYNELAYNLMHYKVFARGVMLADGSGPTALSPEVPVRGQETNLIFESYRTPIYPAFLALIYTAGGNPFIAAVVQSFLSLLLVWLTVLLAVRLFQPEIGWRVALLAALEPLNLIYCNRIMSDFLFALLLAGAVYLFLPLLLADQDQNQPFFYAALGGLLLGLAMLIRPAGIYFPLILLIFWFARVLASGRQPVGETSETDEEPKITPVNGGRLAAGNRYLAVFIIVTSLTVLPWVLRNYIIFHRAFVSTSAEYNLMIQGASPIIAALRDPNGRTSTWEIREQLERDLIAQMAREGLNTASEPERAAYFGKFSLKIFKDHPALFMRYYLKGLVNLFFTDAPGFYVLLDLTKGQSGWANLSRQGIQVALTHYFGKYWPLWLAAALPFILYDLVLYLLAGWGIIGLWRIHNFWLLSLLLAIIGYWAAISSLGGIPRYRLPLMPYLIALAAWGWVAWSERSSGLNSSTP